NAVRLGDEGLFVHALVQAVRIAETVVNCSISVAVIADEYDRIAAAAAYKGLPDTDRDRIEREVPRAVRLERGTPEFLLRVIARPLGVLRDRANLSAAPRSLEPLPNWFLSRIREAKSVRSALREVSLIRESAVELGRMPTQTEFQGEEPQPVPPSDEP